MRKVLTFLAVLTAIVFFMNTTPGLSYEIDHPYFSNGEAKAFAEFVLKFQQKSGELDRQIQTASSEASSAKFWTNTSCKKT